MKFTVSTKELLLQVNKLMPVINSSSVLPVLECIKFDLQDGALTLSASDLEITYQTSIKVNGNDLNIALPAKVLHDTLKNLPDQPLVFTVDGLNVTIQSENGTYKLTGVSAEDFPKAPEPTGDTYEINSNDLLAGINSTLFAVSQDELRPSMTGVLFEFTEQGLNFVATDAHKLSKSVLNGISGENSYVVPSKGLNVLKSAVNGLINLQFSNEHLYVSWGGNLVSARLIDAKYPNYEAVIPTNSKIAEVNRMELIGSLKRVLLYSNKTTNQVVLRFANNELGVNAQDLDFNNEATERLSINYSDDDLTIGFNAKYLLDILTHIESDSVKFELSEPNKAAIIKPETGGVFMLLMPVMVD